MRRCKNIGCPLFFLLIVNLLSAISTSISFSISPFLLIEHCNLSVWAFGCIEGACELLANWMKLVSGRTIDYLKKRKLVLSIGLFLAALSKPFFYFGRSFSNVFIGKLLERLSNGVISPSRDVLVTAFSPREKIGKSFGLMMSSKAMGCVLGSFILSVLSLIAPALFLENYSFFILLSFLCSLGALLLALCCLSEPPILSKKEQDNTFTNESEPCQGAFQVRDIVNLGAPYWSILLCVSFFMLARFNDGLLIVYLKQAGCPPFFYLSTIGIFNFISMLSAYPIGQLLDSGRPKLAFLITISSLFLFNFCFLSPDNWALLLVGVALWGVQRSSSQIIFVSTISKTVVPHRLGTALGLYYMVAGVLSFISAAIAGFLVTYSFTLVFSLSMLAALLSYIFLPRTLLARQTALRPAEEKA